MKYLWKWLCQPSRNRVPFNNLSQCTRLIQGQPMFLRFDNRHLLLRMMKFIQHFSHCICIRIPPPQIYVASMYVKPLHPQLRYRIINLGVKTPCKWKDGSCKYTPIQLKIQKAWEKSYLTGVTKTREWFNEHTKLHPSLLYPMVLKSFSFRDEI